MEIIGWIIAIVMFIIAFIGLVYPIIPSVIFVVGGFLLYGWIVTFDGMNWLFWIIQILFVVLLFGADTLANIVGVKKFGGSKPGMWGSTIGLLVGPFVIPVAGILIGPFIGAVLAELLISRTDFKQSLKTGIGSLVGFLTSIVAKGAVMLLMIGIFIFFVA
ncbi:DUF456 family protein [Sporosarcina thermotolerans]|uniref:DUF456 family protein n=1 Tax=Sporosarcina thermotolerans TaxID=633404 RepID=A0AAW9ABH1_9BACL|nr:DUF456 family protein [Sporosarcina thermotolerans]MDW0117355.1 DUF456 family protein [Sporosarcina thermotolerans]WHT47503.1 DUF456 family protein [Sporosarcina thermotolerans]